MRRRSPGEGARAESSARKQAPAARKSLISSAAAWARPHRPQRAPSPPHSTRGARRARPRATEVSPAQRDEEQPMAPAPPGCCEGRAASHLVPPPPCTHGHTHSPRCPRHHHARQNCDGASWSLGTSGVAGTGAMAQAPKPHPRCPVPAPLAQLHECSPAPVSPPAGFWGRGSVPDAHQELGEGFGGGTVSTPGPSQAPRWAYTELFPSPDPKGLESSRG